MLKRLFSSKYMPLLVSMLLITAAFPPFNLSFLLFVALVPWLFQLRKLNLGQSLRSGFLFGYLFYFIQLSWFFTFVNNWIGNPLLSALPWALSGLAGGVYFTLQALLIHAAYKLKKPGLIPFTWAGVEILRAYMPTFAFPWPLIATPLWSTPYLVQHAALGTIFLVSAWIVLINVIIVEFMSKVPWKAQVWRVAIAVALPVFSLIRYYSPPLDVEKKTISVGQVGVNLIDNDTPAALERIDRNVSHIIEQSKDSDLLILPEGLSWASEYLPPPTLFSKKLVVPTLFAGHRGLSPVYQSAFAWDGDKWSYADKSRLVVFGEFVPFRDVLPFLEAFNVPMGDVVPGKETRCLKVNDITVGPLVCFESLFPDIAYKESGMGANLLVAMSLDDPFIDTKAAGQLRASSVWRAIESGLPLVRSTGLGISMAADARGNVLREVPKKQLCVFTEVMSLPKGSDAFPYRWGFVWVAGIISVLIVPAWLVFGRKG